MVDGFEGLVHADVRVCGEDVPVEVAPGDFGDPGCDAWAAGFEAVVVGGEGGGEAGARGDCAGAEVWGEGGGARDAGGVAVLGVGVYAVRDEGGETGVRGSLAGGEEGVEELFLDRVEGFGFGGGWKGCGEEVWKVGSYRCRVVSWRWSEGGAVVGALENILLPRLEPRGIYRERLVGRLRYTSAFGSPLPSSERANLRSQRIGRHNTSIMKHIHRNPPL